VEQAATNAQRTTAPIIRRLATEDDVMAVSLAGKARKAVLVRVTPVEEVYSQWTSVGTGPLRGRPVSMHIVQPIVQPLAAF
jgi:hypothetical protein